MIGWCDACGKGPVPCTYSNSYCGETVQCYVCAEGEFDPYGEMGDQDKGPTRPSGGAQLWGLEGLVSKRH